MIFIDPCGRGGFKTTEETASEIIVRQDQPFGLVPHGQRNILEAELFLRGRGCGRDFATLALPGGGETAAGKQQNKTQAHASAEARRYDTAA